MGKVYKAMQTPLERLVALKVLNPKYAGEKDPGFERRFFNEARFAAQLHHANTVTVHDYGRTEEGMLFIAMEYVEGDTLQQVLAKSKVLPWPRALSIASQIARSLREAHKLGVIHRDLKPANVMVLNEETGSDMVKVLDFGLVKTFAPDAMAPVDQPELTQAGVLLGSPLYMAPESAKNEADPRADIYSLGVLLFQCLTGRPPFTGKDSIDIIVKHIREKPPRPKVLNPELPDEVELFVLRCLEKEPADRYQSMDEVLEALRVVASAMGVSGAFTDPRAAIINAGLSSASIKKPPLLPQQAMATSSIEVPLDDASVAITAPRRNPLVAYVVAGATLAALVVGIVTFATRKPKTTVTTPPEALTVQQPPPTTPPDPVLAPKPVEPAPKPAPVMVTFDVDSSPPGAAVSIDGKQVGVTPFVLPLEAADDGNLRVQLAFTLDGYQSVTATAEGRGTVSVNQVLKKKSKKRPPSQKDPGFKDDPYQ
ncbi:MAG: serine/threonine protein kinase [Myxococcaceae bacterium]|nr:serine/threonine protein kinase [Myxococcaceae bacterium]